MENRITKEIVAEKLQQASALIQQLNEIGMVCLMYGKGANAEACMERIVNIIKESCEPIDTDTSL